MGEGLHCLESCTLARKEKFEVRTMSITAACEYTWDAQFQCSFHFPTLKDKSNSSTINNHRNSCMSFGEQFDKIRLIVFALSGWYFLFRIVIIFLYVFFSEYNLNI